MKRYCSEEFRDLDKNSFVGESKYPIKLMEPIETFIQECYEKNSKNQIRVDSSEWIKYGISEDERIDLNIRLIKPEERYIINFPLEKMTKLSSVEQFKFDFFNLETKSLFLGVISSGAVMHDIINEMYLVLCKINSAEICFSEGMPSNEKENATRSMNPKEQIVVLSVEGNDLADYVTDALIVTLEVKSMMQRQLLKEVCEEILGFSRVITFRRIFAKLEESGSETSDSERKKNIDFLMNRMYHLRSLDTLQVVAGRTRTSPGVYIWELSDFPDRVSKLLAQFILEIIWKKIRNGTKERVQIILDEFQRLNIEDTAVEEMLREGRKYDLGLTMLSQYMPHRKEAAHILEQASTSLYFQPNERNVISTAKMIATQNYREWIPVLKNLERGSCVLTGRYSINRSRNTDTRPIICKVNS